MDHIFKIPLVVLFFWIFRRIQKKMYEIGEEIKAWALEYRKTREPELKRKVLIASAIFLVIWAITLALFTYGIRLLWSL